MISVWWVLGYALTGTVLFVPLTYVSFTRTARTTEGYWQQWRTIDGIPTILIVILAWPVVLYWTITGKIP